VIRDYLADCSADSEHPLSELWLCLFVFATVDLNTPTGEQIPIEQRPQKEVTHHGGKQMAPDGVGVENPAFDVTPSKYVTAIVTERGIARAPYDQSLRELSPEVATIPR
jgi:methylthioribose-1-phosphate isomerase